ncbi:beta-propeller fold lactonase family protein [Asticcacaulis sp. BYS171W]|uniref:Beta-propeller fold lactonase family protein n=1 Tax=Asticcacaulis aquaticus TaxID=2984212 RepID=A0ABT5HP37_9CAUL|nr:beta-propeller fold lactonase family protein [Asticcacaulis aquaticus]MDC7681823.1 beta-propeller fold lactonase family protein [Asticcacaulis aquaticus]
MDRRQMLAGLTATTFSATPAIAITSNLPGLVRLIVGTFGHEGGKGTQVVETADDSPLRLLAAYSEIDTASYGVVNQARGRVYVTERNAGRVAAYTVTDGYKLSPNGAPVPSMATNPCYVSLSPNRTHLAVANFASDVVAIYTLDSTTGEIKGEPQVLRSEGNRDNGHAHWVQWSLDGKFIYVVDLGHEEVRSYAWDHTTGKAGPPQTAFGVATGSGPRHMALSPEGAFAFLLTEKSGELIALRREKDGSLSEIMRVKAKSESFTGEYAAAHIAINAKGDRVYISERGPDTIRVYAVAKDGHLTHLQTIASGGKWPRFFTLLEPETRLIAANQRSHSLTVFDIQTDGTLKATDIRYDVESPVYIDAIWRP